MSTSSSSTGIENTENIPYIKYFEFFPCERWSFHHYADLIINNYEHAEKMQSHHIFFTTLYNISNDNYMSKEIRDQICEDGDYHHLYCDLTIKKSDDPYPVAVLELLATASPPQLEKHFEQVFKYAEKFCPLEVWIVHFSREDTIVTDPYWPCSKLQDRGLNVVHFWHNKEFTNVRMSSRSLNAT
ncbi:2675_t:CDS:2, partial [Entrophospora sp. SA101]